MYPKHYTQNVYSGNHQYGETITSARFRLPSIINQLGRKIHLHVYGCIYAYIRHLCYIYFNLETEYLNVKSFNFSPWSYSFSNAGLDLHIPRCFTVIYDVSSSFFLEIFFCIWIEYKFKRTIPINMEESETVQHYS